MSNLSRLFISLLTVLSILTSVSSALQFSYSPSELVFTENGCQTAFVEIDRDVDLVLEDYWSSNNSYYMQDYVLDRPLDVYLSYPTSLHLDRKTEFEVCTSFEKNANGLLVAYPEDSSFAFGIWIRLGIEKPVENPTESTKKEHFSSTFLTGKVITGNEKVLPKNLLVFEAIFLPFCLAVIAVLTNITMKKTK